MMWGGHGIRGVVEKVDRIGRLPLGPIVEPDASPVVIRVVTLRVEGWGLRVEG